MNGDSSGSKDLERDVDPGCAKEIDRGLWPYWLRLFLGRQLLRFCRPSINIGSCEDCHLRALCKCAQEDLLAAGAVERRVWCVLAVSGGMSILYALFSFLSNK